MPNKLVCYTDAANQYSHRVRLVLAEKKIPAQILQQKHSALPQELAALNPDQRLPMLLDRGLVLYNSNVIMEYLEERYPHPALLPPYPAERAQIRLLMYRIQHDWCGVLDEILSHPKNTSQHRNKLTHQLIEADTLFSGSSFFLNTEFSLADCCLLPMLWRLQEAEILLPRTAKSLHAYMDRHFERPSFQASLSEKERPWR